MNENEFKPFDKVLVRHHSQQEWRADIYSHKNITTSGGEYHEIIRYEGNEALLGTTDSPKPKRWRAKEGETYWYISSTEVCLEQEDAGYYDDKSHEVGNYFKTQEEAQAMADKFKAMLKGE